jgi:probable phosphoglycerate mutase
MICAILGLAPYKRQLFTIEPCSITLLTYLEEFSCWSVPKINMELPL